MHRHRQRLAGERGLVDDRLVAEDHPVDRHDLARTHEDDLVGADVVDRKLDQFVAAAHQRRSRRALDELGQLAARAPVRRLLERVTAGEHQRDDGTGEVFAERERAGHRDKRDRVDTDVAPEQRPQHRPRQRHEQHRGRRRPQPVGSPMVIERSERDPAQDRNEGGGAHYARRVLPEPADQRRHACVLPQTRDESSALTRSRRAGSRGTRIPRPREDGSDQEVQLRMKGSRLQRDMRPTRAVTQTSRRSATADQPRRGDERRSGADAPRAPEPSNGLARLACPRAGERRGGARDLGERGAGRGRGRAAPFRLRPQRARGCARSPTVAVAARAVRERADPDPARRRRPVGGPRPRDGSDRHLGDRRVRGAAGLPAGVPGRAGARGATRAGGADRHGRARRTRARRSCTRARSRRPRPADSRRQGSGRRPCLRRRQPRRRGGGADRRVGAGREEHRTRCAGPRCRSATAATWSTPAPR